MGGRGCWDGGGFASHILARLHLKKEEPAAAASGSRVGRILSKSTAAVSSSLVVRLAADKEERPAPNVGLERPVVLPPRRLSPKMEWRRKKRFLFHAHDLACLPQQRGPPFEGPAAFLPFLPVISARRGNPPTPFLTRESSLHLAPD